MAGAARRRGPVGLRQAWATVAAIAAFDVSGDQARAAPPLASPLPAPAAPGWVEATGSPAAVDPGALSELDRAALARCGAGEAGLATTARWILDRKRDGGPIPDADEIALRRRMAGEPHPSTRAWAASAPAAGVARMWSRLDAWLGSTGDGAGAPAPRRRRCGVASGVARNGDRVLVVVAADAFADLSPMPVRIRTGQWVRIEAELHVPAAGAHVVVLGPSGWPYTVPTSFSAPWVRAQFAPDGPGAFVVEVMADTAQGPRPVLEATLFADVAPSPWTPEAPAPGEPPPRPSAGPERLDGQEAADALAGMTAAARAFAGLGPLRRDDRLDRIARAHAARMAGERVLAHDVGEGDPSERIQGAGLDPRGVGENVAYAATVAGAHRAMWRSPAHRANIVRRDFDRFGVGVARDPSGGVWAAVEFAGGAH